MSNKNVEEKLKGSSQNPIKINSFEDLLKAKDNSWLKISNRIELKVESENDFAIPGSPNVFVLTYSQFNNSDLLVNLVHKHFYNEKLSHNELLPFKGEWFTFGTSEYKNIINELNKYKKND
jgi:hypothetical protein